MSEHDVDPRLDSLLAELDAGEGELPPEELDAMYRETRREVEEAEKRPTFYLKTRSTTVRRAVALGSFFVVGGVTAATMLREDFGEYPMWRMVLALSSVAVLLTATMFASLRPTHVPELPRVKSVGLVLVSCLAVFVLASLPMAESASRHEEALEGMSLFAQAMPCIYFGLLFGVPIYVIVRLFDRVSALSAFLAAAAAGLAGNFVLQLHCPIDDPVHDVAGHAGVVVLFLVLVAVIEWVSEKLRKRR